MFANVQSAVRGNQQYSSVICGLRFVECHHCDCEEGVERRHNLCFWLMHNCGHNDITGDTEKPPLHLLMSSVCLPVTFYCKWPGGVLSDIFYTQAEWCTQCACVLMSHQSICASRTLCSNRSTALVEFYVQAMHLNSQSLSRFLLTLIAVSPVSIRTAHKVPR